MFYTHRAPLLAVLYFYVHIVDEEVAKLQSYKVAELQSDRVIKLQSSGITKLNSVMRFNAGTDCQRCNVHQFDIKHIFLNAKEAATGCLFCIII